MNLSGPHGLLSAVWPHWGFIKEFPMYCSFCLKHTLPLCHYQCTASQLQIHLVAWSVKIDLGPLNNIFLLAADMMLSLISWGHWRDTVGTRSFLPFPVSHLPGSWRAWFLLQCLNHIVFISARCLHGTAFSSIWPYVSFNSWLEQWLR